MACDQLIKKLLELCSVKQFKVICLKKENLMKKAKLILSVLLSVLAICSVYAGGQKEVADFTEVSDTLRIALESNIGGLDPRTTVDRYSGNVYGNIYEPLLTYDDAGNIVCNTITESFEQIDDVTYHFIIKPGIMFHNGEEMKASDVKFSLERGIGTSMDYLVGDIASVDVIGDYEFNIILKASNGAFLAGQALACPARPDLRGAGG